jgi:hypothetical protein
VGEKVAREVAAILAGNTNDQSTGHGNEFKKKYA